MADQDAQVMTLPLIGTPVEYPKPGDPDAPPATGKKRGRPAGSASAGYRPTRLKTPIENGYKVASKMALRYDPPLAMLLREHADSCATAWDEWAKTNKTVNKVLTWAVELKSKGGVASAHLPFALYLADRFHLLERVPMLGDALVAYIETHVNELLQQAIAEGILEPAGPADAGEMGNAA